MFPQHPIDYNHIIDKVLSRSISCIVWYPNAWIVISIYLYFYLFIYLFRVHVLVNPDGSGPRAEPHRVHSLPVHQGPAPLHTGRQGPAAYVISTVPVGFGNSMRSLRCLKEFFCNLALTRIKPQDKSWFKILMRRKAYVLRTSIFKSIKIFDLKVCDHAWFSLITI